MFENYLHSRHFLSLAWEYFQSWKKIQLNNLFVLSYQTCSLSKTDCKQFTLKGLLVTFNLDIRDDYLGSNLFRYIKGTISVISSDSLSKEGDIGFTTVPFISFKTFHWSSRSLCGYFSNDVPILNWNVRWRTLWTQHSWRYIPSKIPRLFSKIQYRS